VAESAFDSTHMQALLSHLYSLSLSLSLVKIGHGARIASKSERIARYTARLIGIG